MNQELSNNTTERWDWQKEEGQYLTSGYRVRKYQGETFLVPDFLVPSAGQAIAALNERKKYEEAHTQIGVSLFNLTRSFSDCCIIQPRNLTGKAGDAIANGKVNVPVDPVCTGFWISLIPLDYVSVRA